MRRILFLTLLVFSNFANADFQFKFTSWGMHESGNHVTVIIQRTGDGIGVATLDYATSDGNATAGEDYEDTSGQLYWASGDTSEKGIWINHYDDLIDEVNESFVVTISNPTGGVITGTDFINVTISDNDLPIVDTDGDGVPDSEDEFPNDPLETVDSDLDGVGDNSDPCPNDPFDDCNTTPPSSGPVFIEGSHTINNGESSINSINSDGILNIDIAANYSNSECVAILRDLRSAVFYYNPNSYSNNQECIDQLRSWIEGIKPEITGQDWVTVDDIGDSSIIDNQITSSSEDFIYMKRSSVSGTNTEWDGSSCRTRVNSYLNYFYNFPTPSTESDCYDTVSSWVDSTFNATTVKVDIINPLPVFYSVTYQYDVPNEISTILIIDETTSGGDYRELEIWTNGPLAAHNFVSGSSYSISIQPFPASWTVACTPSITQITSISEDINIVVSCIYW